MSVAQKVKDFLHGIDPAMTIVEFEQDTSTSTLAAQALGTEVAQIAKSILLKDKKGDYIMLVLTGDARLDNKKLREINPSRLKMASPDEVLQVTGFSIGGVCPFALKEDIPVYLDNSLKRFQFVYTAAGTANTVVPVSCRQLTDITGGTWCDVAILP